MEPKEKAEELFIRFNKEGLQQLVPLMDRFDRKEVIKQCALIAVDEIVKNGIYSFEDNSYWEEVKQEIEKL